LPLHDTLALVCGPFGLFNYFFPFLSFPFLSLPFLSFPSSSASASASTVASATNQTRRFQYYW
jgi:hypothetical protein